MGIEKSIDKPIMELPIRTADKGFYSGFNINVTVTSKIILGAFVLWAIVFPTQAGSILKNLNNLILANFAAWYVYVMASFVLVCIVLAIWPTAGRMKLGVETDEPEFSNFSWFSMMFGAGIGVGMLTWAIAEPIYHFGKNPDVILGNVAGGTAENASNAFKWAFLHWGFSAWSTYAIAGLALAYFAYRRNLPLTIRSALTPLFGARLSGGLGNAIDIVAVIATILGVAQALGFGVEQFVAGMHRIGVGDWLLNDQGTASPAAIVFAITIIMGASTWSAFTGVGKGIKWLSNINMVLSIFLLSFLILFGASWFGLSNFFQGIAGYLINLPSALFTVYRGDGTEVADALEGWQGAWSIFNWAWWIAFAPFVGLFLARISKGRTIREFVLGAILVPTLVCFTWFSFAGGTAISMELSGEAAGAINSAPDGAKIFVMTGLMLSPTLGWMMAVLIVVLLMTFLVTSADSAVLVVNTINAAGHHGQKARRHILFWGVTLGLVVAVLLLAGGLKAIQTAMVIGALPFSVVMVLMWVSVIKAIYRDGVREKAGVDSTVVAD